MHKNKPFIIYLSIIVVLILLFALVLPVALDTMNIPVSDESEEVLVVIEENTSTLGIGKILKNNKLIRSEIAFFIKAKTTAKHPLSSGTYTFNRTMTTKEIIELISRPKQVMKTITITFPEGYSVEQMAMLVEEKGLISKDKFIAALGDKYDFEFIKHIPEGKYNYNLQGFLFPDTYEFFEGSSAHDIIYKMLAHFEDVYLSNASQYEDMFEVVTKASIIEKEAKLENERPIVAGVIENRIKKGMPLQIDATVLYEATNGLYNETSPKFIADNIKNLDSPYNTYKYAALPPGPIGNPGLTSIRAALNPKEHSYLYYHTDTKKNDGSHIFTESLNAHISTMN